MSTCEIEYGMTPRPMHTRRRIGLLMGRLMSRRVVEILAGLVLLLGTASPA